MSRKATISKKQLILMLLAYRMNAKLNADELLTWALGCVLISNGQAFTLTRNRYLGGVIMKTITRVAVSLLIVSVCIIGLTSCWLDIFSLENDSLTVGDVGPAGGYIFFDKGSFSEGWRYLEAAPAGWSGSSLDPKYPFGHYRISSGGYIYEVGTSLAIGSGKANTDALVEGMGSQAYASLNGSAMTAYAAKIASDYSVTVGGVVYDDWFLPSRYELDEMYKNLKMKNRGGFSNNYYWSSSEYNYWGVFGYTCGISAWHQNFVDGDQDGAERTEYNRVRPIRAF